MVKSTRKEDSRGEALFGKSHKTYVRDGKSLATQIGSHLCCVCPFPLLYNTKSQCMSYTHSCVGEWSARNLQGQYKERRAGHLTGSQGREKREALRLEVTKYQQRQDTLSQGWTAETPGHQLAVGRGWPWFTSWCLEGDLQKQLHFSFLLLVPTEKSSHVGLFLDWWNQLPHGGKKKGSYCLLINKYFITFHITLNAYNWSIVSQKRQNEGLERWLRC